MTVEKGGNLPAHKTPIGDAQSAMPPHRSVIRTALFTIRGALGVLFWTYVVTKLFIFDIDRYLFNAYAPSYIWLIDYRSLVFLGVVGAVFLLCRWRGITGSLVYVLLYPVVLFLWSVIFVVWRQKNWNFVFHFLNAAFAFFKRIRYNIPLISFYLIALVLVVASDITLVIGSCDIILLFLLVTSYVRRVYSIFKPDSLFDFYRNILIRAHNHYAENFKLDEDIRNLPVPQLESMQLEKWKATLEIAVLANRIHKLAAKKLRDYQRSGLPILSGIFVSMGMMLFTAITFAGIDFGVYKIWPEEFTVVGAPGFFSFFYYAFNGLFFSGVREITPSLPISQGLLMMQYFCSLFLVAIFISLLLAVRQQRHSDELDEVICAIEHEGAFVEDIIRAEYRFMTIDDAITELEKLQSSMLKFLLFLSRPL